MLILPLMSLSAARTYIKGHFPSSCYRNALGSVPPSCVRVVGGDASAAYAHGLTAPILQVRYIDTLHRVYVLMKRKLHHDLQGL